MKRSFLALVLVGVFCFGIVGCSDYKTLYEIQRDRNDKLQSEKNDWQKEKEKLLKENSMLGSDKKKLEKDVKEKDEELNYYYSSISPYLKLGDELAKDISDTAYASARGNIIQIYVPIVDFDDDVLYETVYEYIYNMLDKVYKRIRVENLIVFVKFMSRSGRVISVVTLNAGYISSVNNNNYKEIIDNIFNELIYLTD